VVKPAELERAETIDAIAQRYGCLPSAVLAEDASILVPIINLVTIGQREAGETEPTSW
tara:strand:+ start:388 stop:561 length:174 start_codon:yes stop_codon:yes gene_type:complete